MISDDLIDFRNKLVALIQTKTSWGRVQLEKEIDALIFNKPKVIAPHIKNPAPTHFDQPVGIEEELAKVQSYTHVPGVDDDN